MMTALSTTVTASRLFVSTLICCSSFVQSLLDMHAAERSNMFREQVEKDMMHVDAKRKPFR